MYTYKKGHVYEGCAVPLYEIMAWHQEHPDYETNGEWDDWSYFWKNASYAEIYQMVDRWKNDSDGYYRRLSSTLETFLRKELTERWSLAS